MDSTSGSTTCIKCMGSLLTDPITGACSCPVGRRGTADTCADCTKSFYCEGGVYAGPNTPQEVPCGNNMTTLGKRSTSIRACVNMPGTFYSVDGSGNPFATPCPADTFGPGLRKQRACVPCPPGFTTRGVTGSSLSSACVVPEGYYLKVPGQVAVCPLGEYKAGFSAATSCIKCTAGVTTSTVGSQSEAACNIVRPGYYPEFVDALTGAIKSTRLCAQEFVCSGGQAAAAWNPREPDATNGTTVVRCPDGLWTERPGSSRADQCMTPPGHKTFNGSTTACQDGEYRPGFAVPAAATSCIPCGEGISSTATEQIARFNISTGVATSLDVRASAASCYILPGQGSYFSAATNTYMAVNCDSDSFGASNITFGLSASPCRDCPASMQANLGSTNSAAYWASNGSGKQGFTNPKACVTKPGFGYNGRSASKCAVGSFNAGGNYETCTQCPLGLSTADNTMAQVSETNCTIAPGYGLVDGAVAACPLGTYNDRLQADRSTPCTQCPTGRTTTQPGGASIGDCNLCAAGYGGTSCSTQCGGSTATYGPAGRAEGSACEQCPAMTGGFFFSYQGINQAFTPAAVAVLGADSPAHCLAEFGQLVDGPWYLSGSATMVNVSYAATFAACVADCKSDPSCQYITFDYDAATCWKRVHKADSLRGNVVAFKALVAGDVTANSNPTSTLPDPLAKGLTSGSYTFWGRDNGTGVGVATLPGPTSNFRACLRACDRDRECAVVIMTGASTNATAPVISCGLLKGDTTFGANKRTVVKAVTTRLTMPTAFRWGPEPVTACPAPTRTCSSYTVNTILGRPDNNALPRASDLPYDLNVSPLSVRMGFLTSIEVDRCTDTLYMTDLFSNGVYQLSTTGGNLTYLVTRLDTFPDYEGKNVPGQIYTLSRPQWLTSFGGFTYIVDTISDISTERYVRVVRPDGSRATVAGSSAGNTAEGTTATGTNLNGVRGPVVFDADGSMFLPINNRVRRVDAASGAVTSVINVADAAGKYNGEGISAADAWLDRPHFILFTPAGDMLVVERESHRIRLWNRTTNTVSSVFNRAGASGQAWDNIAITARANNPMQVVNAARGYIFVDENNYVLRQVFPDGTTAVIAGNAASGYSGDGGSALLAAMKPERVTIDSQSNLYIMSSGTVRKLTCNP